MDSYETQLVKIASYVATTLMDRDENESFKKIEAERDEESQKLTAVLQKNDEVKELEEKVDELKKKVESTKAKPGSFTAREIQMKLDSSLEREAYAQERVAQISKKKENLKAETEKMKMCMVEQGTKVALFKKDLKIIANEFGTGLEKMKAKLERDVNCLSTEVKKLTTKLKSDDGSEEKNLDEAD